MPGSVNTGNLSPAGGPLRLALFDFDGTISRLNSYHVFLRWILRQPNFCSLQVGFGLALRRLGLVPSVGLKNLALRRLRGASRGEVAALGENLYREKISPSLIPEAIAEVRKRQLEGFRVIIVSGAFDFILEPFCREHEIQHYYGARVAFAEGLCLGRLEAGEMRGEEKLLHLRTQFPGGEVDWHASCAYGDEPSDLALLNAVGHPFLAGALGRETSTLRPPYQKVSWK